MNCEVYKANMKCKKCKPGYETTANSVCLKTKTNGKEKEKEKENENEKEKGKGGAINIRNH